MLQQPYAKSTMTSIKKNTKSLPALSRASLALSKGVSSLPPELRLIIWTDLALQMTSEEADALRGHITFSYVTDIHKFLAEAHPILTTRYRDEYLENLSRVTRFTPELSEWCLSLREVLMRANRHASPRSKEEARCMVAEKCMIYNEGLARWINLASVHSVTSAIAPISIRLCMTSGTGTAPWMASPRDYKLLIEGCLRTLFRLAKYLPEGKVSLELVFNDYDMLWRTEHQIIELPITIGRHRRNRENSSASLKEHLEIFNKEHHSVKINILEYSESLSSPPLTNASTFDISALFSASGSATVPIPMISMSANWAFLEMTHRCLTGFVAIACCLLFFFGDRFSI
ncbi:hypothetical protein D6D22_08273 [Aureobasidium pullulans]|uniref:Uncharacterized protein n=1 Tax=Aureobasidium pullulans TaxID=5580 RepID=A0A4S8X6Y1_AURPU|nr:hypothetical protein D6D22_08273 [Aureobasidium pullulans]